MRDPSIDRPVFVIGVDHSGTTILYRMIARHPELAWLSQYSLRDGSIPGRMRVPFGGWINRAGRRLTDFTWRKREKVLRPEPSESAGTWRRLIPRSDEPLWRSDYSEEVAERVRSAIRAELEAWHLNRIIFKIPYLTRAVALLDRILPDALFIHIIRDGRAVALSNRRLFLDEGRSPREALRAAARYWGDTLDYIDRCAPLLGERLWTVRYEDLCENVHQTVSDVWSFCGLDTASAYLAGVPVTLEPTNARWIENCPDEDRDLLDETLEGTLRRLGYARFGDLRPVA